MINYSGCSGVFKARHAKTGYQRAGFSKLVWQFVLVAMPFVLAVSAANAARFNHPSGIGFDYPGDWQLRDHGDVLMLLPPGSRGTANDELILVGGENLGGISDLQSTAVRAWFDQQMAGLFGAVRQTGFKLIKPSGAQIDYAGRQGATYQVRYLFKGPLGIYVVHVRPSKKLASVGMQVFKSVSGEFARDRALIGTWSRTSSSSTDITYDTDGGAGSYVGSSSTLVYQFAPDGRVFYSTNSRVYGQVESNAGSTVLNSGGGDPNVDQGEYVADGKSLWILWADGDWSEWQYNVFRSHDGGMALKLTTPGRKKPLFFSQR